MYIKFKSKRLKKQCETYSEACKAWGPERARKVIQRLNEIKAAPTLRDLGHLPPARCHALTGDYKGRYAVNLTHNYRLIFEPIVGSGEAQVSGPLQLSQVREVRILEVIDYHGD